jgi:hypothetical protein
MQYERDFARAKADGIFRAEPDEHVRCLSSKSTDCHR